MDNSQADAASPMEALQAFVLDSDLECLEDLLAEFNLFEVLKIERGELHHSAVIAWLLDPRGTHGLRGYFVRKFLSEAAAGASERGIVGVSSLDVDGWELSNVEVEIERHYANIERNYVDIMLIDATDGFVCLIENKIGSGEHSDQLSRYLQVVESEYKGFIPFPIFLTPDGRKPEAVDDAKRYVPFGYRKVAELIDRTLRARGSTISTSVAGFLEQYTRTLRRHVLDANDHVDELALQIYKNHRDAIDIIIKVMPSLEAVAWDVIDTVINQHAPCLRADSKSKGYRRFYAPELDGISELEEGRDWTKSGRILLFEFRYNMNEFVLLIGPGPEETRKRLFDLFQGDGVPGVAMRSARNLNNSHHVVYRKHLPRNSGSPHPDYENHRREIELLVQQFFENDYWPIVNAIRAEFGLPPA